MSENSRVGQKNPNKQKKLKKKTIVALTFGNIDGIELETSVLLTCLISIKGSAGHMLHYYVKRI